jgi:hypothetical protein
MRGDINTIHHPGIAAVDIEASVKQLERLGFMFTPLSLVKIMLPGGEAPVYIGAGNRNAIFERNFLEIVGIADRSVWNAIPKEKLGPFDLDKRLGLYEGLHIMHFGADDIEVVRERFKAEGIASSDIAQLQRGVETLEGERTMIAKTIFFPPDANPEALIQVAQHVTPELALQPRYMDHPNGARRLTETIVCGDAPDALAAKYARYSGKSVTVKDGVHILDLGEARVLVADPAGLDRLLPGFVPPRVPFVAAITVASRDLDATARYLDDAGIPFASVDGRIAVSPDHGSGAGILFEAMGATR